MGGRRETAPPGRSVSEHEVYRLHDTTDTRLFGDARPAPASTAPGASRESAGCSGCAPLRSAVRMAWRLAFLLLLALGLHLAPTAASADTTPPEFSSAAVRAGGTSIWLTMNEALDRDPADLPLASAFVVTVAGTDYPVAVVGGEY